MTKAMELIPALDEPRFDKRRAKNGIRQVHDLKELRGIHHQILRLTIYGLKPVQIAERLGCSSATVSLTLNSTLGKEKLALMQGAADADAVEFDKEVSKMIGPALKVYHDILNGEQVPLTLKKATADTIIKDIAGKVAPKRVDARHIHAHVSREEIEDFKLRGYAAAQAAGIIVEEE